MLSNIHIHQIFYNDVTRQQLDPGFIPLDNRANERPDWYEFWPIRNWLKSHSLAENGWYGFLSPQFFRKTGLASADVMRVITPFKDEADTVHFSNAWDQAAYFTNVFEQGELWHPGITALTQSFFDTLGDTIDLKAMVNDTRTSVFSNFIIAKPVFWRTWLSFADAFFAYAENDDCLKNLTTNYRSASSQAPMKTFIQERFASIILSMGGFTTIPVDMSQHMPMYERLFNNDADTKKRLAVCDFLKTEYLKTRDVSLMHCHHTIRSGCLKPL
jgi:hypothetical protein